MPKIPENGKKAISRGKFFLLQNLPRNFHFQNLTSKNTFTNFQRWITYSGRNRSVSRHLPRDHRAPHDIDGKIFNRSPGVQFNKLLNRTPGRGSSKEKLRDDFLPGFDQDILVPGTGFFLDIDQGPGHRFTRWTQISKTPSTTDFKKVRFQELIFLVTE